LPESAQKSLPMLAAALVDKPELNLDIPAGVLADVDGTALARKKLMAAAAATVKPGKEAQPFADWEPKQQLAALEALYKQQFGSKPDIPKAEATPESEEASRKEKRATRRSAESEWLEAQLLPKFQPTAAELAALGQARGEAVQDALLKGGTLEPSRVFLTPNSPMQNKEGMARMELAMK
jgi:hypothetical protein